MNWNWRGPCIWKWIVFAVVESENIFCTTAVVCLCVYACWKNGFERKQNDSSSSSLCFNNFSMYWQTELEPFAQFMNNKIPEKSTVQIKRCIFALVTFTSVDWTERFLPYSYLLRWHHAFKFFARSHLWHVFEGESKKDAKNFMHSFCLYLILFESKKYFRNMKSIQKKWINIWRRKNNNIAKFFMKEFFLWYLPFVWIFWRTNELVVFILNW